jgi:DNA-directed RNA polymerase subunit RPC12/RpoP
MPKGQKTCENCGTATGPRAFVCKNCNHQFVFKPQSKEAKNTKLIAKFNWRELQKGDRIKVSGGPYFLFKGEFIPMGYRGRFVVEKVDEKGICAWGLDKHTGFAHIYMGKDYQNKVTNIWKTKHKVLRLKSKEEFYAEQRTTATV